MRPHDLDVDRLAKITALLDSPVEGERIAAFEAVRRALAKAGLVLADIVRLPATQDPWHRRARRLLETPGLSEWEKQFLYGIAKWRGPKLSAKQDATLARIEADHG